MCCSPLDEAVALLTCHLPREVSPQSFIVQLEGAWQMHTLAQPTPDHNTACPSSRKLRVLSAVWSHGPELRTAGPGVCTCVWALRLLHGVTRVSSPHRLTWSPVGGQLGPIQFGALMTGAAVLSMGTCFHLCWGSASKWDSRTNSDRTFDFISD